MIDSKNKYWTQIKWRKWRTRPQNSKINAQINQSFRQMTTGMQFRPRIPGPQTIVQRLQIDSKHRQLCDKWRIKFIVQTIKWIRGPSLTPPLTPLLPPKPPNHLRPNHYHQKNLMNCCNTHSHYWPYLSHERIFRIIR